MIYCKYYAVLVFLLIQSVATLGQSQDVATKLRLLLQTKDQMVSKMSSMKKAGVLGYDSVTRFGKLLNINAKKGAKGIEELHASERVQLESFVGTLQELRKRVKEFYDMQQVSSLDSSSRPNLNAFKRDSKINDNIVDLNSKNGPKDPFGLLSSFTLSHNYNRKAGLLFRNIRKSVSLHSSVNMKNVCKSTKDSIDKDPHFLSDLNEISLTDICSEYLRCATKRKIYTDKRLQRILLTRKLEKRRRAKEINTNRDVKYMEEDISDSCVILTSPLKRNRCKIPMAVPLMTGLLKFEVTEMIYHNLCPEKCKPGKCTHTKLYRKLMEDINRLLGYVASHGIYFEKNFWPQFFKDAVAQRAFSNLNVALNMVEGDNNAFELRSFQCHLVKLKEACPYADIFRQFTLLKKLQNKKNVKSRVKDLRKFSKMNKAEMLKLKRDDLKHTELLGTIKQLDENLKVSIKGISRYFQGLATYDESIALADVGYIQSSLKVFESDLRTVETDLSNEIGEAMGLMQTKIVGDLADAVAKLAVAIATNSNPLKILFTGPDLTEIMERADAVANAAADVVRGFKIVSSIQELADDATKLNNAFSANSRQLESMDKLVELIKAGKINDAGVDADKYLKSYGDYTPAAELTLLEKNNALWSAFKDSICDLLYGDAGVSSVASKSIAGEKLICERLEGTLAQFFTLREQIYDFQFDLVDSLAAVVRGNVAKRLAADIGKGSQELVDAKQLMTGFFLMQYKIQKVSAAYCDVLEYQQLGSHIEPCATVNGIFIDENVKKLIAYSDQSPYNEERRMVYLPTRAEENGDIDTGIVDLTALSKGKTVLFKIPVDYAWLQKYKWLLPGEKTIPFIKNIKLFLPHKTYDKNRVITTQVTLVSVAGSATTAINPKNGVVYMLPKAENTYSSTYETGYSHSCSSEIENPYSMCKNLPKICQKSERISGHSLSPTILSTFSIQANIHHGTAKQNYDAPSPGTPLLIRAKVVLKVPLAKTKKSRIPSHSPRSSVVTSKDGCCKGQSYRLSLDDKTCGPCPKDTTAYHGGLYCQINKKKSK